MSAARLVLLLAVVLATGAAARTGTAQRPAEALDLGALPMDIGGRAGVPSSPPDEETLAVLGADATLYRLYAGSATPVSLYAAYYGAQRPGVSIHSPLHCLPGTGWEPLAVASVPLPDASGAAGTMRRMLVRNGTERAVVLYWYSIAGRITGNEVTSKLMLLAGNATGRRHGAALVRIVVPVSGGVVAAEDEATAFARDLLPHWTRLVG